MKIRRSTVLAAIFVATPLVILAICTGTSQTTSTPHFEPTGHTGPLTVGLKYDPQIISSGIVQNAISMWTSACGGAGAEYPQPVDNVTGDFNIELRFEPSSGSAKCGSRSGNTITLYAAGIDGGRAFQCNESDRHKFLAHELGHWYGLAHTSATSACEPYVMHPSANKGLANRAVQSQECTTVRKEWVMRIESEHPDTTASSDDDTPDSQEEPFETPILIDVHRDGFHLVGLEEAVWFDIDADGSLERVSWTDRAGNEMFLALDRDGNGRIDDGSELFGSATPQPEGTERNGYRALQVYDRAEHGGNQDGKLSATDAIYASILLWRDRNHDGISQATELGSLAVEGILSIDLSPVVMGRRDRHGNLLRWGSRVDFGNGSGLAAVDVIFMSADAAVEP